MPGAKTQDRAWSDRGGYVRGFDERFDPTGFTLPAGEIKRSIPSSSGRSTACARRCAVRGMAAPLADDAPAIGLVLGNLSYPTAGLVQFAESTWFAAQAEDVPRPPDAGVYRIRATASLRACLRTWRPRR